MTDTLAVDATMETMNPPGFWLRAGAYMIDGFIISAASIVIGVLLKILGMEHGRNLLPLAATAAYATYMIAAQNGQTFGKMAAGIRVVRPDGTSITLGRAFGRWAASVLSGLLLMIGYVMAAFTDQQRALHDFMADTRVISVEMVTGMRKFLVYAVVFLLPFVAVIGILAAIAIPQFADLVAKSQEGQTKASLGMIRSALATYYGETDGHYPSSLDMLTGNGKTLPKIPMAILPHTRWNTGHASSAAVTYGTLNHGAGITDTGGWFYDNTPGPTFGQVVVNCSHADSKGKAWDQY